MSDHDASPPLNVRPGRAARPADADAANTNLLNIFDTDLMAPPSSVETEFLGQAPAGPDSRRTHVEGRPFDAHRAHKHRSSGGFLLADPLLNRHGSARHRDALTHSHSDKRRRVSAEQHAYKTAQHGQESSQPRGYSSSTQGSAVGLDYGTRPGGPPEEGSASTTVTKRDSLAGDTAVGPSPRASMAQLDMESAQIVTMALNLSESRRRASRRNVSQPTPPRLAPLPDGVPGGSLRQHLQQQRKMSRTVSPRPDRTPKIGASRILSPLQSALEPEGTYRYHFSQSTLSRAQKAKEYLELMAQYRRILELLPPLEPPPTSGFSAASLPSTPNGSVQVSRVSTTESDTRIGRAYNPLQYIRNRKVRARERKAIDGEEQGFNDVIRVSEWIDEVAKWVATGQARTPGNPVLPPFAGAQAASVQSSPPSTNPRAIVPATKPKRPRVDWVIDPADMIADVYWLELDDNKKLVEDRHWRRVFTEGPDAPRPRSRDEAAPRLATPGGSAKDLSDTHTPADKVTLDPAPSRHDHEHVLSAARDRAQQKLRAFKSAHHRHAGSITKSDLLRLHRGSLSESSDTDSDRRRRARGGAATSTVRSVLEKQMEEMIAREQRDAESHPLYDHEALGIKFPGASPMTPERDGQYSAATPNSHRRLDSRAELSEAEGKGLLGRKPQAVGRASLEVPEMRRLSLHSDTSQPNSPAMRPARDVGRVPAIGMDLSPMSSRPGSPSRNPLAKVKDIFRERSKERSSDAQAAAEDSAVSPGILPDSFSPETAWSGMSSPERQPSRSPVGERLLGHRSHKGTGTMRPRGDDGGLSFRSLLRPRIDTVLRSGVSKVSDIIWRRESGGLEDPPSSTSSDDSDADARGRSRGPRSERHSAEDGKRPFEGMPEFTPEAAFGQFGTPGQLLPYPPAQPLSRRSSRFDLLKPPRIDVQNASPSVSPPPQLVRQRSPAGSDTESPPGNRDRDHEHARAPSGRLDTALTFPAKPRPPSTNASSHHWPLPGRGSSSSSIGGGGTIAVSRREVARLRALLLSSGIHAMELDRRTTKQPLLLPSPDINSTSPSTSPSAVPQTHIYPLTARSLSASLSASTSHFQALASQFATGSAPALERRVDGLRTKLAGELITLAQSAIDAADEANHDLVVGQRLKVKRVVDGMDKMLRRRRRRFRWVRRAGWLAVEWVLVGFMWYVWFVVMITRVVFGVGKGFVRGVRWLLWL
ncbi:Maintenance of telomere capping protein 4 [Madurella fahalii]|uniref:Maintenance of telomere capping protein 4 n=1 Tax=Madurella fahalii TaxID=1157608 RepID=A0ABQ0FWV7_9PEZI